MLNKKRLAVPIYESIGITYNQHKPFISLLQLPAKANNFAQEEGGAEYCEDKAQRGPDSEEDGAFHHHAPCLKVVGDSSPHEPLVILKKKLLMPCIYIGVEMRTHS